MKLLRWEKGYAILRPGKGNFSELQDRPALDRNRVRYLAPNQTDDELFFAEEDRYVRADNFTVRTVQS